MIVDRLHSVELESAIERRARVRWDGGEQELCIEVPPELAPEPEDASPVLACVLPLAMRCHEHLQIDGSVSRRLLRACPEIQAVYGSWGRGLERTAIEVAEEVERAGAGGVAAGFFSRGADSMYTALVDRDEPLTALLFADGIEPLHDGGVRQGEMTLAREAADRIGLPLITVRTNLRELTDVFVGDWEDQVAAGLAFVALSLAGGLHTAVVPSSDTYGTLEPCGTSPLLDPLFSTERVSLRHDSIVPGRAAKLAWLAENRPDVLRWLKVCFRVNGTGNCGRCGKCLITMVGLHAVGALRLAEQFPAQIDHDAVAAFHIRFRKGRLDWLEAAEALERSGRDEPLRQVILDMLERSRVDFSASLQDGLVAPTRTFRDHHANSLLAALAPPRAAPPRAGLLRSLDTRHARHVYRLAEPGPGLLVGELGSLLLEPPQEEPVPLWISQEGRLATDRSPLPGRSRPSARAVLRWLIAPLAWRGFPGLGRRLLAVPRRALLLRRRPAAELEPSSLPAGYLHGADGEGRLPLWSAVHPITGDQLLSTWRFDAVDMGYGAPLLLGYLEARAPVTGRLSVPYPEILWASRFGQRVRMA